MAAPPLRYLVFLGSVRTTTPPRPARVGDRVAKFAVSQLTQVARSSPQSVSPSSSSPSFAVSAQHPIDREVEVVDPLIVSRALLAHQQQQDHGSGDASVSLGTFKPYFSYTQSTPAPPVLRELALKISAADGFVMCSPEYNHSMSPALMDLLNLFGSSLFSYKPSLIVTYSTSQWGGLRAAVGMRTFLGELGCLPVSSMVHIPRAHMVLDEHGQVVVDGADATGGSATASEWEKFFGRGASQLDWWARQARRGRQEDAARPAGGFTRDPSQRNAPATTPSR